MKKETYHLYAAAFNEETAKIALDEPYSKASKTHVLIYKKGKCPEGYKEIKNEDAYLLPGSDVRWLQEVNIELIKQFVANHREADERSAKKFLEDFERELNVEREKLVRQGSDTE